MATKAQALNSCGRLRPGYKFKKGGGVYAVKKGKAKRRTRGKRGATGSLF